MYLFFLDFFTELFYFPILYYYLKIKMNPFIIELLIHSVLLGFFFCELRTFIMADKTVEIYQGFRLTKKKVKLTLDSKCSAQMEFL